MKFARFLEENRVQAWAEHYVDYRLLKKRLKAVCASLEAGTAEPLAGAWPGAASLSIARASEATVPGLVSTPAHEEAFLVALQQQIARVAAFTEALSASLRESLQALCADAPRLARAAPAELKAEARRLGDEVLELERFIQLNQAGFVKIIKKHDKNNPGSPIWHLYVHHLQHQPWVHDGHADLWALVSDAFYQLHASGASAAIAAAKRPAQAPAAAAAATTSSAGGAPSSSAGGAPPAAAADASFTGASFTGASFTGASFTGAPFTGASFTGAAPAAAAAAATAPAAAAAAVAEADTRKYWVALEDVSAVVYFVLQHMPLLPAGPQHISGRPRARRAFGAPAAGAGAAAAAAARLEGITGKGGGGSGDFLDSSAEIHTVYMDNSQSLELYHGRLYLRPNARTLKVRWLGRGSGGGEGEEEEGPGRRRRGGARRRGPRRGGDGSGSEDWSDGSGSDGRSDGGGSDEEDWVPRHVVVERKIYREGWKGEPNTKDAMLMAGDVLPSYLAGNYTLPDALRDMHSSLVDVEAPTARAPRGRGGAGGRGKAAAAAAATPGAAAVATAAAAAVRQRAPTPSGGPFAAAAAAAADAAAAAVVRRESGAGGPPGRLSVSPFAGTDAGSGSASVGGVSPEPEPSEFEHAPDPDAGPSGLWLPPGVAIGSPTEGSLGASPADGEGALASFTAADAEVAAVSGAGGGRRPRGAGAGAGAPAPGAPPAAARAAPRPASAPPAAPAPPASEPGRWFAGFADRYLTLPAGSDQLSLFSEVQRLVARKRLAPVLHCAARRMLFQMPFDDRVRVCVDLDIKMRVLDEEGEQRALELAALAARGLARARKRRGARLRPAQLLARLRSGGDGGGGVNENGGRRRQQQTDDEGGAQRPSEPESAAEGGGDATGGGAAGEEEDEAEGLAWELWRRLYNEDVADDRLSYALPYAVLKISTRLPPGTQPPAWLQTLASSDYVTEVEDWSKYSHGCAVLMPDTARAVPYWVDDHLIELSTQQLAAALERTIAEDEMASRAASALPAERGVSGAALERGASGGGGTPLSRARSGSGGGLADAAGAEAEGPGEALLPLGSLGRSFVSWVSGRLSGGGGAEAAGSSDGAAPAAPAAPAGRARRRSGRQEGSGSPRQAGSRRERRRRRRDGSASASSGGGGGGDALDSPHTPASRGSQNGGGSAPLTRLPSLGPQPSPMPPPRSATAPPPRSTPRRGARGVTWHEEVQSHGSSSSSDGGASDSGGAQGALAAAAGGEGGGGEGLGPGAALLRGISTGRRFSADDAGGGGGGGNSSGGSAAGAADARASGGGGGGALGALRRRMERKREKREAAALEDGALAHAGNWRRRRARWHPVQLLEARDFLHNESAFMGWLNMAVTLASAGVLLLAVGALAYVSPLEAPGAHVAEATALLLLPAGVVLSGYAIWSYQWRFARLTSMRHKRVDDRVGPNVMLAVVTAAFCGVLLLHAADLAAIWAARGGGGGGGGDDDPTGGGDPGAGP